MKRPKSNCDRVIFGLPVKVVPEYRITHCRERQIVKNFLEDLIISSAICPFANLNLKHCMKAYLKAGAFLLAGLLLAILAINPFAPAPSQAQVSVSRQLVSCGSAGTPNTVLSRSAIILSEQAPPTNDPNLGVRRVTVNVLIPAGSGLTPGLHGVHIHETGSCGNTTGACLGANGHWDRHFAVNSGNPLPAPVDNSNSQPNGNHPFHLGDLQNIFIRPDGSGVLTTFTNRVVLAPNLPLSLNDADGSAIIIHAGADNYCPAGVAGTPDANPACNSGGARSFCSVIYAPKTSA
jgi:Cu/Zn superoxide dismutase